MKGFIQNIEESTLSNSDYRRVLYTGKNSQLVLMTLKHGEEIGEEVHKDNDQFFRFEGGEGKVMIDDVEHDVTDGFAVIIPAGAKHNVINTGAEDLKLYTIYSPAHHKDGTIHHNKTDEVEEEFDGITTE
jgi:mannose-6-phosphate isomerase-like protein (cupin superfamily)